MKMTKKQFPDGFFTKDRPIAKPRLIDSDDLREYWLTNGENERVYNTNDFLDSIDCQPTADVQPVIHCKDCIHWHNKDKKYLCPLYREELKDSNSPDILWTFTVYDSAMEDDFFCKRGETDGDEHD